MCAELQEVIENQPCLVSNQAYQLSGILDSNRPWWFPFLEKAPLYFKSQTWSDGEAEAFLNPMTNFPSGSIRLNVTEETTSTLSTETKEFIVHTIK